MSPMAAKDFTTFAKAELRAALNDQAHIQGEWTGKSGIVWARFPLADGVFGYWLLQRRSLSEMRAEVAISRGERNPGEFFGTSPSGLDGYRARASDIAAVHDWWPAQSTDEVRSSTEALLGALQGSAPAFYVQMRPLLATGV